MNEIARIERMFLRPGEEIVSAPYGKHHQLRAHLREAQQRGEIGKVYNWTIRNHEVYAIVERLRPARRTMSRSMKLALAGVGTSLAAGAVGWLVWRSLPFLFVLVKVVAVSAGLLVLAMIVRHIVFRTGTGCSCIIHGHH